MAENSSSQTSGYVRFASVGAAGGLCAFFLSRLLGAGPFINKPIYFDLPGEALFGACAALFGVYLLTASDVTVPRTIVFALACGFFWSPVLAGVQAYINQYSTTQNAIGNAQQASSLASQISTQSGAEATNTIQTASSKVTDALTKVPSVSDSSKSEIVKNSTQVVNSIPVTQANTESVDALKNIGVAATKAGTPQVTAATVKRLQEIASQPQTPVATRNAAIQAAQTLSRQAKP